MTKEMPFDGISIVSLTKTTDLFLEKSFAKIGLFYKRGLFYKIFCKKKAFYTKSFEWQRNLPFDAAFDS